MNKSANYDVLTCAGCLPVTGLDYNLFLKCMPNEQMLVATAFLTKDKILGLRGSKIFLKDNPAELDCLHEHENPAVVLVFLEGLLNEMKACPNIEDDRNYISVLHTFQTACKRFCGWSEDMDDRLAELSASLVDLTEEPLLHFITRDMTCDKTEYLSLLCNAEEALVLKVLDRAYNVPETKTQLKLFRFISESLRSISYVHHNLVGVNDSTQTVDNLLGITDERIEKLEVLASLEEALAELEREFGPLPTEDG